jgi:hypothetical protein
MITRHHRHRILTAVHRLIRIAAAHHHLTVEVLHLSIAEVVGKFGFLRIV